MFAFCVQREMEALWKSLVPVPVPSPPAPSTDHGQPDASADPEVPLTPPAPKPRPAGRKRPRLPDAAPVQQQQEEEEEEESTELSGGRRPRRKAAKNALDNIHGWTAELRKKDQLPNKVSSHHFCLSSFQAMHNP